MNGTRLCMFTGCDLPFRLRGLCQKHYARSRREGWRDALPRIWERIPEDSPAFPMEGIPLARFEARFTKTGSGCWEWQGPLNQGYGSFNYRRRVHRSHRISYQQYVGPIPDDLVIDHLCRNRSCVNPTHLETVTAQENYLRGQNPSNLNRTKTHCIRGHEFTPDNLYNRPDGIRTCRACDRIKADCPTCGKTVTKRHLGAHARRMHSEKEVS